MIRKHVNWLVPLFCIAIVFVIGPCIMSVAEGTQWLKQSTQITVRIGPILDVGDGFTPEVDFDVSASDECELLKHTGAVVSMSGVAIVDVPDCNGWYDLTLTTAHTDTLGALLYVLQDDSVCWPIWKEWMVVDANMWDPPFSTGQADIWTVREAAPLNKVDIGDAFDAHSADANSLITSMATALTNLTNILADTALWDTTGEARAMLTGTTSPVASALGYTTIATLASQTSFTLTAGSTDNDAYNGCTIVIEDATTAGQKARGTISDYVGSGKTVTLDADPGIFTMQATDKVTILPGTSISVAALADIGDAVRTEPLTSAETFGTLGWFIKLIGDLTF